jgi:signal transduction histidine kinase/ligand-binding sensor domain-containing protein/DNA-binding response OmpR family regulator
LDLKNSSFHRLQLLFLNCLRVSLLAFSLNACLANAEVLKFSQLDVSDGLPNNTVRDIKQDQLGFIWFATELGLARYDGVSVKAYLADSSKLNTIADSYVRSISVDDDNVIWISSGKSGLSKYNRATDDFTILKHQKNNSNSLSSNSISELLSTKNNILWIATEKSIDRFNTKTKEFQHFFDYLDQESKLIPVENSRVRVLAQGQDGAIWVGSKYGLSLYKTSKNVFEIISLKPGQQPQVLSIVERNSTELWVGTTEGLFLYDFEKNKSVKIDFRQNVKWILSLYIDNKKNLWIGTSQFGLFRMDQEGNIINMRPDKSNKDAITDSVVLDIMQDHSGMMWLGTYNTGTNSFNPQSLQFGSHDNSINSLNCLSSTDILSALALDNNSLYVGTTAGLYLIDLKNKSCKLLKQKVNKADSVSNFAVYAIHLSQRGELWIGTSYGLSLYDTKTNSFQNQPAHIDSNARLGVYKIVEHRGIFLLASNLGLFTYEPSSKRLRKVETKNTENSTGTVYSIEIDKKENIWVASSQGLFLTSSKLDILTHISPINEMPIDSEIWGVATDTQGNLWITIDGRGIYKYYPSNNMLEPVSAKFGIGVQNGFGELQAVNNSIWLSTFSHGLFKLNLNNSKMTNFNSKDGLLSEQFNHGAFTRFPDGRILFGGTAGFNIFHPDKINENNASPIISLTQFLRFGKKVIPHQEYDGFSIKNHISSVENLKLGHKDAIFGFGFMGFDYLNPTGITYSYILENFDQDWTETSAQNRGVTYNNVSPGDYTFRVKAKNSRGIWSENDVALKISIAPAPWLTWWAYTLYAISTILLVWFTFNKRTQWLKKRAIELENTVNLRTKELATEKEKVEKLLSRKNEEFANVSHEFRTPLTLILGPVNQLVNKSKDSGLSNKLNVIQRNAIRLLRMVDQLLNLETFRVKAITQKSPQAIGKITQLIAEAFADLAEEKQITFNIETIEPVCFDFTPDAFEKIILNLLSNAIKYTKPGGAISISATRIEQAQYQIQVSDTGIGIAKDKLEKVFERFNRVMDENSEQVTGSGIGLALVKSLVESHDGSVELESELGQGTTITVTLPIVNEVDESQINVHQNDEIIAMELMNVSSSGLHESSIAQSAETIQSTGKPTVLVIEDNDDMRQYIVESIGQQFNTLVAADGQAGLELAIQEVPDLIISDIMMPKLDGYQTTKALREAQITNHIPVVLLTARGDRDSRLKGWEEKADEYITKPFDVEELIIRISNLIEIRNILKRRFSETVFEQTEQALESSVQEMDSDSETLSIVEINTQRLQQEFIEQLNQHIESVYMEAELAVVDLAKAINMSERQFYRKLRSVIDMTPSEYLRRFRLEKSKEILRSGKTANFTAFEVGFSSQAYFSKCFKAQYNMTPKQFVNQT